MLDHPDFEQFSFDDIPLDRDLILMGEQWMHTYEQEWLKYFQGEKADLHPGYVSCVAARSVNHDWLELSWYPNTFDRFHEVSVFLPKLAFIACVGSWRHDEKPHIFVREEWLTELHERPLAAFSIIDAIGVKDLLRKGELSSQSLHRLRDEIDEIADRHENFAFISFADSLLVKQVWSMGHVGSEIKYTYSPEALFPVISELRDAFRKALGVSVYAAMTQGVNAYGEGASLHTSIKGNHVSLDTLGLPFAQLMSIEEAARQAIRSKQHLPAELYLDVTFFRSLRLKHEFDKKQLPIYPYKSPMTKSFNSRYVATSIEEILLNLE